MNYGRNIRKQLLDAGMKIEKNASQNVWQLFIDDTDNEPAIESPWLGELLDKSADKFSLKMENNYENH